MENRIGVALAALKLKQGESGINADGEYGPQTHNRMWWSDTIHITVPTGYDCGRTPGI
jgi:hypothetical protein